MSHDETHSTTADPQLNQKKSSARLWTRLLDGKGADPAKAIPSIRTSSIHGEASTYPKSSLVPKPQPSLPVFSELEMDPEPSTLTINCESSIDTTTDRILDL